MRYGLVTAVLLVLILGILVLRGDDEAAGSITVRGRGEVAVVPDTATVTLGTLTLAETAEEAMARNADATRAALEALKAAGVEAADIRTSGLTLRPVMSRPSASDGAAPRIEGYEARGAVTARVRDLAALGGVLDAAVSAGANEFRSLGFGLADPTRAMSEARRKAVADARAAAEALAEAAGVDLGALTSIDLMNERGSPVLAARDRSFASAEVPVAEGRINVGASVRMVWETK